MFWVVRESKIQLIQIYGIAIAECVLIKVVYHFYLLAKFRLFTKQFVDAPLLRLSGDVNSTGYFVKLDFANNSAAFLLPDLFCECIL
jgi:hypothetical protein